MKRSFIIILIYFTISAAHAQNEKTKIERACLDYIEGFYEGDTTKLIRSLKPTL